MYLFLLLQSSVPLLSGNTINHCISSFLKMYLTYASTYIHTYTSVYVCLCVCVYIYIYILMFLKFVWYIYSFECILLPFLSYAKYLRDIFMLAHTDLPYSFLMVIQYWSVWVYHPLPNIIPFWWAFILSWVFIVIKIVL